MTRVVIVGGGFGGVRAALSLANKRDINVKLISSQNIFEYHAALYRSATGRSPLEVAIPLNDFFADANNIEVVTDTITDLNAESKFVASESGSRYEYDSLILALGSVTDYFGIKGLKAYSYGVKSIHQALKLKRHLHEQLLRSETDREYVVVGAGATGVELSAELTSYLKKIRRKHKIKTAFVVNLIESGSAPLANMPKDFSKAVERRLRRLNVKLFFNTPVKSETADAIKIKSKPIHTQTVVWTAGTSNNPFFSRFPKVFTLDSRKRVEVNEYLQAKPDIYVIGDSASTPYSGMAQTALHDAMFVANNICRKQKGKTLKTYRPKRPIYAIPVGTRWAAVLWGNRRVYGRIGWGIRRLADLRLYLTFLPFNKALTAWRYGFKDEEICSICRQ